jgi:hypothetical protein
MKGKTSSDNIYNTENQGKKQENINKNTDAKSKGKNYGEKQLRRRKKGKTE